MYTRYAKNTHWRKIEVEILKRQEKILIELNMSERQDIFKEYIEKNGYKILEEWFAGNGKIKAILFKGDEK